MSRSVLTLNAVLLLFCIQTIQKTVCPKSCCECILGGQEVNCNENMEDFCETSLISENSDEMKAENVEIKYLLIKNSPIYILSEIIDGKRSLKSLKMVAISVEFGWNWGLVFQQLDKLTDFHLEKSQMPSNVVILRDNEMVLINRIVSFSLIDCQIESIETNIMNEWTELKMLSLAHNRISQLNRNWFPSALNSLWSIDLSYNSIDNIPQNYFEGMNALRKLRLDNNSLKTLRSEWFGSIWNNLHELWIDHNLMVCNSDMSWIPSVSHPTFFDEGECHSGVMERVRYFWELKNCDSDITEKTD